MLLGITNFETGTCNEVLSSSSSTIINNNNNNINNNNTSISSSIPPLILIRFESQIINYEEGVSQGVILLGKKIYSKESNYREYN